MTAGALARELLEFFGPEGERWIQGHLFDGQKRCFQGAVSQILLGVTQYATSRISSWISGRPSGARCATRP
jgi:hypothetical protein